MRHRGCPNIARSSIRPHPHFLDRSCPHGLQITPYALSQNHWIPSRCFQHTRPFKSLVTDHLHLRPSRLFPASTSTHANRPHQHQYTRRCLGPHRTPSMPYSRRCRIFIGTLSSSQTPPTCSTAHSGVKLIVSPSFIPLITSRPRLLLCALTA